MKIRWNWTRILMATAMVALLVSGSMLFAAKGGNGGGGGKPGGEDPPPPPEPTEPAITYEIQLLENTLGGAGSWAFDLNELGEVVGHADAVGGVRHAFVYTDRFSARFVFHGRSQQPH